MSDTQLHDSVTPAPSTATPGELLSRQRESLGVPLADAARALNLRPANQNSQRWPAPKSVLCGAPRARGASGRAAG